MRLATEREFHLVCPLTADDKAAIVRRTMAIGARIHLTWTCYLGRDRAYGTCDACQLRISAFPAGRRDRPCPVRHRDRLVRLCALLRAPGLTYFCGGALCPSVPSA